MLALVYPGPRLLQLLVQLLVGEAVCEPEPDYSQNPGDQGAKQSFLVRSSLSFSPSLGRF